MPIAMKIESAERSTSKTGSSDIVQLWLLRLLIPLELHRKLVRDDGVQSDALASALGIDADDPACKHRDRAQIVAYLRDAHAQAERQPQNASSSRCLRDNLNHLSMVIGLSKLEQRIFEFVVRLHSDRLLEDVTDELGALSSGRMVSILAVLLKVEESLLWDALGPAGTLSQSGLLQFDRGGSSPLHSKLTLLSSRFAECMLFPLSDPVMLLAGMVNKAAAPELSLSDYEHMQPTLDVLVPYLEESVQSQRKGVNILVHGSPGTGKTQLARVLAAHLKCDLFEVTAEDEDGDPLKGFWRLCAYRAAQSFLRKSRSMIAFDEIEDVCGERGGGREATYNSKAWFNRTLEENQVPTLWIANDISGLDAAFIRRFDMVFELAVPPRGHRLRIVRQLCAGWLDDAHAQRIADAPDLAPAVIARAARVTQAICSRAKHPAPPRVLCQLIDNTLKAQGHARLGDRPSQPIVYDPGMVSTDVDLNSLAEGLAQVSQARICLYGPPGTGKTAYARWLASRLERPLKVERASDILSKWVGETERNLARCFRQADEDGAVLLIDEVDSLLQDRRHLSHSWQITMVNEMLTQMEEFRGIFVATTNLLGNLDQATLRRFDLKARFGFLAAEQARSLFTQYCRQMNIDAPPDAVECAGAMRTLTPGDFAAVARQARFRPFASPADFVSALKAECALKEAEPRAMGFVI